MLETSTHPPGRLEEKFEEFSEPHRRPSPRRDVRTPARIWRLGAPLLVAAVTFVLLWLLSPGLRSDLADFVSFVGSLNAASIKE